MLISVVIWCYLFLFVEFSASTHQPTCWFSRKNRLSWELVSFVTHISSYFQPAEFETGPAKCHDDRITQHLFRRQRRPPLVRWGNRAGPVTAGCLASWWLADMVWQQVNSEVNHGKFTIRQSNHLKNPENNGLQFDLYLIYIWSIFDLYLIYIWFISNIIEYYSVTTGEATIWNCEGSL